MAEAPKRRTVASKGFMAVYANTVRLRVGDNDGSMTFMLETDDESGNLYNLEQVQVIMTPRGIKTLQLALTDAVAALEKVIGSPIEVAPNLTELLRQGMKFHRPDDKE